MPARPGARTQSLVEEFSPPKQWMGCADVTEQPQHLAPRGARVDRRLRPGVSLLTPSTRQGMNTTSVHNPQCVCGRDSGQKEH